MKELIASRATLILLFSCVVVTMSPAWALETHFDAAACRLENRPLVLCFDLRDDAHPRAGLVVLVNAPGSGESRVFLPFHTTNFEPDESLLSTWGNFENFTLVSFLTTTTGIHAIGFDPVFDSSQESLDETLTGSALSFVRLGLERRFVYRQNIVSTSRRTFPSQSQQIGGTTLDAIGVLRPKNATGLELRNGKTEEPDALPESGQVRFYPAIDAKGTASRIELRYELPPTSLHVLIFARILKVAAALTAPFFTVLFFTVKDNIRPRTRNVVLWVLGVLQLLIFGWLLYAMWASRDESTSAAAADWVVVAVTAIASAIPLWLKREPSATQFTVRP